VMERCATGEHRGEGLHERGAEVTAIAAAIIADREPGWESLQAVVWSARDVWPHLCAPEPLSRYCWSYDRSFRAEPCSGVRSLIAAYGSDDALDQYDWAGEELCPMPCEGA
jgi:hypothetical protein